MIHHDIKIVQNKTLRRIWREVNIFLPGIFWKRSRDSVISKKVKLKIMKRKYKKGNKNKIPGVGTKEALASKVNNEN